MTFPDDLRYTKDHEWVRLDGDGTATIGITDYAQGELGDIVFVEIEAVGTEVDAEAAFGTVEAVKTVSELFAPVAGTIEAINDGARRRAGVGQRRPLRRGLDGPDPPSDAASVEALMSAAEYKEMIGA